MKNVGLILSISCIFVMSLYFSSCNKNKKDTVYYTIPDTVKAYYLFQPGSYWIYQYGIGQIDCTYVSSLPKFYQVKKYDSDGNTVISVTDHYSIELKGNIFHLCVITGNEVRFDDFIAFNSNANGYYEYGKNNCFYYLNYYDSLDIGFQKYFEVLKTRNVHYYDEYVGTFRKVENMEFLSAKNVGLIKIDEEKQDGHILTSKRWTLIRCNIVQ